MNDLSHTTLNLTDIKTDFSNSNLASTYNTQTRYGIWFAEFINEIGRNYSEYLIVSNNQFDADATYGNISVRFASFIYEKMGAIIDTSTVKSKMLEEYNRINSDTLLIIDTSMYDVSDKSPIFVSKFHKILHIVNSSNNMMANQLIDSMKNIEQEINFSDMSILEKNDLFEMTALISYTTNYMACVEGQADEYVDSMGKISNSFQAAVCCKCSGECWCDAAINQMISDALLDAALGGLTGIFFGGGGFFAGWAIGAGSSIVGTIINKKFGY
jgi:hypothetical protein